MNSALYPCYTTAIAVGKGTASQQLVLYDTDLIGKVVLSERENHDYE
jgi:hypothetical protein